MTSILFFVFLIIFPCFSINLPAHLGLSLELLASAKRKETKKYLIKLSMLFPVIILLWLFITSLKSLLLLGFLEYILLFPFCYLIFFIMESSNFISKLSGESSTSSDNKNINTNTSIAATILFIVLNITDNFLHAITLTFGFLFGIFLIMAIIIEIKYRTELEKTPRFLKGTAIMLIAIGLLSIIFSSSAMMLLRILRVG